MPRSLAAAAIEVLLTGDPAAKAAASRQAAAAWREGSLSLEQASAVTPPARPKRPDRPLLIDPRQMPRRSKGQSLNGRIALLHAVAHIELNAVDLAWDIVARFAPLAAPESPPSGGDWLPRGFFDAWVTVGDDEARHFTLVAGRLQELGATYGDLPAHDGLWKASQDTAGDLLARLAIVPMVFEARGLDVTPPMIQGLRRAGDQASADILQIIHDDEIGHVGAGVDWFDHVCRCRGIADPMATWQDLVRTYYGQALKRPFNADSRSRAGMDPALYEPLGA